MDWGVEFLEKCTVCGKGDPDISTLYSCSGCYHVSYCCAEHAKQDRPTHITECEQISLQLNMDLEAARARFRRARGKSKYPVILAEYAHLLQIYAKDKVNSEDTSGVEIEFKGIPSDIEKEVLDDDRKAEMKIAFGNFHRSLIRAIDAMVMGNVATAVQDLDSAESTLSGALVRIWGSDAKLSRSTKNAIMGAWKNYVQALRSAIMVVPLKDGDMTNANRAFDRASTIGTNTGKTLGGGGRTE